MAEQLQKLVAQKKDVVETVMEVFEQGAEVVASIAGDLFPVFSIAAPIVKLALDNVESKEAEYMKEQFQKVRDRLEVVSEEVQQINQEIKKSGIDATYFSVEENLTNQFRKFMDVLNAKPKFRDVRKKTFLEHFNRTGGDKNLHILYNAVTGDNFSGESVLEITLNYEQKSRRAVEEFCATLKKLFCVGLIALLGHSALKGDDDEEKLLQDWGEKMKVVQNKMNIVIEDCINSFPTQAELDAKCIVRDQSDKSNQQLADLLVEHLKKKYDWVCWSVRIFNSPTGLFTKKKVFHVLTGKSRFQVPSSDDKLNVVVSYSASPEPVDKARIQSLISEQKNQKKVKMTPLAEQLFETIPVSVVHTIKTSCKDLGFSSSFSDELHFFEEFKKFHVFIHSA
uniref:Rapunzel 4 n=1 Tax=Cyprinus carpio TaxID=7962 RepID=A0A8C1KUR9_CYPCA